MTEIAEERVTHGTADMLTGVHEHGIGHRLNGRAPRPFGENRRDFHVVRAGRHDEDEGHARSACHHPRLAV